MEMSGIPTAWWLWWFVVPTVLYVIIILWFRAHGRQSDAGDGSQDQP